MLEMLATTAMSPEQGEMVEVIRESARTLLTIIDDILDLSKIEAGKLRLEAVPLRLPEIIESATELVARQARDKGVEVAYQIDPDVPEHCVGDPVRLRQILLNLMSNGVKFTEEGSVTIRVRLVDTSATRATLRFEVTDTGIGLSPEQQARLFQPFSQAESSTTRRFGGTGLGLSICRRLTGMMGGEIAVTSAEGQGATFWFQIPLGIDAEMAAKPWLDLAGASILVVEGQPVARSGMADILRRLGATVAEAGGADEAMALLGDGLVPDVALVDERSGLIQLAGPLTELIAPRYVLPMGFQDHETLVAWGEARSLGTVLLKPVRAKVLARMVAMLLGRTPPDGDAESLSARPKSRAAPTVREALRDGRLVLVAEDNRTNRLVLGKQLTRLGYAYEMAENGELAWTAWRTKPYGLLLTDCFMPVLDGYGLAARIRAAESLGESLGESGGERRLPIVALTANALQGEAEKCMAAGMDGYLRKPVALDDLAATLARWLPEPEIAGVADAPPVDLAALAEILGDDDPVGLAEVVTFFTDTYPELAEAMRAALEAANRLALRDAAHAGKGEARNAAATPLGDILAKLEDTALGETAFTELGDLLNQADRAFAAVRAFADGLREGK
jgi:CheY-like chemotaxis protein/HPt (histidine-containing phosphotransfer) domain-containing protein